MLKTRVIPALTVKGQKLVKSVQFANHRNIGSYMAAVRVFNARDVDEMVFLDLDGGEGGLKPWLLREITKECFMPLAIGGGIRSLEDIRSVLKIGADKIVINTAALKKPEFISEAAKKFGAQCVVVSIDAKRVGGGYKVFADGGKFATGLEAVEWAREAERRGAGEILLTSIDRDGMMDGYEIELVKSISGGVKIPVIASGGAGNLDDCLLVIKEGGASALAAASIFQYTQITPMNIKEHLAKFGVETRAAKP